eukprot:7180748-Prymnesium_polylepis.1
MGVGPSRDACGGSCLSPRRTASRDSKEQVVLCVALGGSSDIIGVVALARTKGYRRLVLLQPGSPPRGGPPVDM